MKRLVRIAAVAVPLLTLTAAPLLADAKKKDNSQIKFEFGGMLGGIMNKMAGKAAKEGITSTVAVKGNRKASINDTTGQIVDLSEEKVYDLNIGKKEYTVTTFDEIRKRMREAAEDARKQQEKEEPGEKADKPQKEYEIDWDVKETGQKKQIAGHDTHQTIVTITVREKGKTLEQSGGMVLTNDMWLGPRLPEIKELTDFELRYWKQLQQGTGIEAISPQQAAQLLALFPLAGKAMERMAKDGDKLAGTPLETTMTIEGVKSPEEMTQSQQQSTGGGLTGGLMRKMMKKEPPKQRSTVMTTHNTVLEVSKAVTDADLAIPADFKQKK